MSETAHETPAADLGPRTPYELGLVMAGAISAGAYTAGVVDFLIEALDAWEAAKAHARAHPEDPASREVPDHEVSLKVLSGASAGGITAALTAGQIGMQFDPVRSLPTDGSPAPARNNNLYQSWVNRIDIQPLLGLNDLQRPGPVRSILDSTILEEIASKAFQYEDPQSRIDRPYVADPLQVILTVTNLRGVPYAPRFRNWPTVLQYEMFMHADNVRFRRGQDPSESGDDALWLRPYQFQDPETWGVLQEAALATGAFPVGLAPRLLSRSPAHYQSRRWPFPGPHDENGIHYCQYWKQIAPYWPSVEEAEKTGEKDGKPYLYQFLCVDGGVMDNEPLDLARQVLLGPSGVDQTAGEDATRSVIMIMPFPNAAPFPSDYQVPSHLIAIVMNMFNSLIQQARFRPSELITANDPHVYSRFLVVPRRGRNPDDSPVPRTIASGSLGGFGGFLSRRFREHDYQLGRRNCQWFLKQYFALPSEGKHRNPLFDHWSPEAKQKHRIRKAAGAGAKSASVSEGVDALHLLPIIPLVGQAAETIPEPSWPCLTRPEFEALRPLLQQRLGHLVVRMIQDNFPASARNLASRLALRIAWWFNKGRVVRSVMEKIEKDLLDMDLLEPQGR